METAREYNKYKKAIISIALEFIGMDEKTFTLTQEEISRNNFDIMRRAKQDEETVRLRIEKPEETKYDRDEIKNIVCEQYTMLGELQK